MADAASAAHSAAATCHFRNTPDNGVKGLTVTIIPLLIAEEQADAPGSSPPPRHPDDATEAPTAPRADPLSSHTHLQHSCHPVLSGVVKGAWPRPP
jgi:hypothetical protein